MFEALTDRLSGVFDKLTGRGALSEADVEAVSGARHGAAARAVTGEDGGGIRGEGSERVAAGQGVDRAALLDRAQTEDLLEFACTEPDSKLVVQEDCRRAETVEDALQVI